MSKKEKKLIRKKFRDDVFERDRYTCQICGLGESLPNGFYIDPSETFDAHHITDRSKIPNGGYVKENGITVCKDNAHLNSDGERIDSCHMRCEEFHISDGTKWEEGLHPNDLYEKIGSSHELACIKSKELK